MKVLMEYLKHNNPVYDLNISSNQLIIASEIGLFEYNYKKNNIDKIFDDKFLNIEIDSNNLLYGGLYYNSYDNLYGGDIMTDYNTFNKIRFSVKWNLKFSPSHFCIRKRNRMNFKILIIFEFK